MTKELKQLLLFIQNKLFERTYDSDLTVDQVELLFILEGILDDTIKEYLE